MEENFIDKNIRNMFYDVSQTLDENVEEQVKRAAQKLAQRGGKTAARQTAPAARQSVPKTRQSVPKASRKTDRITKQGLKYNLTPNEILVARGTETTNLKKIIQKSINQDLKTGFRMGENLVLGPKAQKGVHQMVIRDVADITATGAKLSDAKISELYRIRYNEALEMASRTEARYLKNLPHTPTPGGTIKPTPVTPGGKDVVPKIKPKVWGGIEKIKGKLKKRWWLFLGIAGFGAAYYFLTKGANASNVLDDESGGDSFPPLDPNDSTNYFFPWCILDMLEHDHTDLISTDEENGDPVAKITQTGVEDYDNRGGLLFYVGGGVLTVDGSKRGLWRCREEEGEDLQELNELSLSSLAFDLLEQRERSYVSEIDRDVNRMIRLLDWATKWGRLDRRLYEAKNLLLKYANSGRGPEFLRLYQRAGWGGGDLKRTLRYLPATKSQSVRMVDEMRDIIEKIESGRWRSNQQPETPDNVDPETQIPDDEDLGRDTPMPDQGDVVSDDPLANIIIDWDRVGDEDDDSGGEEQPRQTYSDCEGKDLPHEYGCTSTKIADVQRCLGVKADKMFGPITRKALEDLKYDVSNGLTQEIYDAIMRACDQQNQQQAPEPSPEDIWRDETASRLGVGRPEKIEPIRGGVPIERTIQPPAQEWDAIIRNINPNDFYRAVRDANLLKGEDGNKRIKYRGPELHPSQLERLDTAFNKMGYARIKQLEDNLKRYGAKYVWQRR